MLLILLLSYFHSRPKRTSSNQSEFVLLISDFLLLNVPSWEEKSHHSFEELVHKLDGEGHHVHLVIKKIKLEIKYS